MHIDFSWLQAVAPTDFNVSGHHKKQYNFSWRTQHKLDCSICTKSWMIAWFFSLLVYFLYKLMNDKQTDYLLLTFMDCTILAYEVILKGDIVAEKNFDWQASPWKKFWLRNSAWKKILIDCWCQEKNFDWQRTFDYPPPRI